MTSQFYFSPFWLVFMGLSRKKSPLWTISLITTFSASSQIPLLKLKIQNWSVGDKWSSNKTWKEKNLTAQFCHRFIHSVNRLKNPMSQALCQVQIIYIYCLFVCLFISKDLDPRKKGILRTIHVNLGIRESVDKTERKSRC